MAKDTRRELEAIAVDMIVLSMEYIGLPESEIWEQVQELSDSELISYICD